MYIILYTFSRLFVRVRDNKKTNVFFFFFFCPVSFIRDTPADKVKTAHSRTSYSYLYLYLSQTWSLSFWESDWPMHSLYWSVCLWDSWCIFRCARKHEKTSLSSIMEMSGFSPFILYILHVKFSIARVCPRVCGLGVCLGMPCYE